MSLSSRSKHSQNLPVVAIVGPTAVGKTALALRLGQTLGAEVISADSRQVYRGMDIGTAKPTPEERRLVPHHLIDVVDPDEPFGLAQYQAAAYAAIDGVRAGERLPLLVGGSGQYVRAVVEGWGIPHILPDQSLRDELYRQAEAQGSEALYVRLQTLDPIAAARIDHRNVRRVIRALEVCLRTGERISDLQRRHPPPYHIVQIGLTMPRQSLYHRIDERVDRMFAAGLVAEVQSLVACGYDYALPSMSGLGYRQIGAYLRGGISLDEAAHLIKRETRRFVRQQYNWFRLDDERIRWFDVEVHSPEEIEVAVRESVEQGGG